jgi:hypothetical protein
MKPDQEKKKVRPYLSTGLRMGIERAFLLMGLTSGALHSWEMAKGMAAAVFELHSMLRKKCCRSKSGIGEAAMSGEKEREITRTGLVLS